MTGIDEKIVEKIAERIGNNEKLRKLATHLGFSQEKIQTFVTANYEIGYCSALGTRMLLNSWKEATPKKQQRDELRAALEKSGLGEIADDFIRKRKRQSADTTVEAKKNKQGLSATWDKAVPIKLENVPNPTLPTSQHSKVGGDEAQMKQDKGSRLKKKIEELENAKRSVTILERNLEREKTKVRKLEEEISKKFEIEKEKKKRQADKLRAEAQRLEAEIDNFN